MLIKLGTQSKFIKAPVAMKKMWDRVQGMHQKLLLFTFIIGTSNKTKGLDAKFQAMANGISFQCEPDILLHLKLVIFGSDFSLWQ
jgi:hypothetical protein